MAPSGIPRAQLIRLSLWISGIQRTKLSFKFLSNNVTSVDVTCAEAWGAFALVVCFEATPSLAKPNLPQAKTQAWKGKTSALNRRGAPYWE